MSGSSKQASEAKTTGLLILSIVANFALAIAAARLFWSPASLPPVVTTNRMVRVAFETQTVSVAGSPASLSWITNGFHWRQVESTNYEDYVTNLRTIGCPEKTLRDIVLADVRRHYWTRQRAVKVNLPFWTGGRKLKAAERDRAQQVEALEKEEAALLQRLLGIEWTGDQDGNRIDSLEDRAIVRFLLGPMEDEKVWRVARLIGRYETFKNDLNARTSGILLDPDEVEARNLVASLNRELQTMLTPAEWEEMIARTSAIEMSKNTFSEPMDLTPLEGRQIALMWSGNGAAFDFFGMSRHEATDERELHERQFTNSVAQFLGEERFADFQRAQDGEFQRLFDLALENNLAKETAVKVYDIRRLAAEEVERLRKDVALNEPARQQQFNQMQSELQKAVSGALGPAAYQEYLRGNGAWITNVTQL